MITISDERIQFIINKGSNLIYNVFDCASVPDSKKVTEKIIQMVFDEFELTHIEGPSNKKRLRPATRLSE